MSLDKPYRLVLSDGVKTITYFKHFATEKEADTYFMGNHLPSAFNGWAVDIIKFTKELGEVKA